MSEPSGEAWTDLGGGVLARRSRAYRMNSLLLLDEGHTVLVDPGVLPSELDDLAAVVAEVGSAELTLILSHAHWDHVLGRPWWPAAGVIAHDLFAGAVASERDRIRAEAEGLAAAHGERYPQGFQPFGPDRAVSGIHFTRIGPWRLVLRDAPGHCDSQLTLHLPELGILFAADMLSDIEIPMLDRPPAVYRRTLEALVPLAEGGAIETLVPGHGAIAEGADAVLDRLRRDLAYLDRLESEVRAARARGLSLEAAQAAIRPWEDVERDPAAPMAGEHRLNVRTAWESA